MESGDSKLKARTEIYTRLCQPLFRHPFRLDHLYRHSVPSLLRWAKGKQWLWMNQERRRLATSRWRGTRSLPGVRNPKAAKPGVNCHHLCSSLSPYPSGPSCTFDRGFERQSEEGNEYMLRPDLRASVVRHRRRRSKQKTRAIKRASVTHCPVRNQSLIENSSERIERKRIRGKEQRGRVDSDSRYAG